MLSWLKAFCKAIALICIALGAFFAVAALMLLTGKFLHAQFGVGINGTDAGCYCVFVLIIIVGITGVTVLFKG